MKTQGIAFSLAAAVAVSSAYPITVKASVNFDLRRKVIGVSGIMSVTNIEGEVSRAEFARMLVNASSYGSSVSQSGITSVFADVAKENEYAAYIRIAADQGWMMGYLGGNFKPEQPVTLQEAVKGILMLLGYTNEDFTGDQNGSRLAKYHYLELDEEVGREAAEILNKEDCINLFYNLLKAEPKNGSGIYGAILNCELTADGEINPLTMADNNLKGPKIIRSEKRLENYLPFDLDEANFYLNGDASRLEYIKDAIASDEYVLIYYHPSTKTVWAYSESGEDTSRAVVTGTIAHIYYNSTDVLTPSAVSFEEDEDIQYLLKSSDMQFAFSMYGDMRIGDEITLVYQITTDANGDETYTVIDYVEE